MFLSKKNPSNFKNGREKILSQRKSLNNLKKKITKTCLFCKNNNLNGHYKKKIFAKKSKDYKTIYSGLKTQVN